MKASEHIELARRHLRLAMAQPMLIGRKQAEAVRSSLMFADTQTALAAQQLEHGVARISAKTTPFFDHRRAAANEGGSHA